MITNKPEASNEHSCDSVWSLVHWSLSSHQTLSLCLVTGHSGLIKQHCASVWSLVTDVSSNIVSLSGHWTLRSHQTLCFCLVTGHSGFIKHCACLVDMDVVLHGMSLSLTPVRPHISASHPLALAQQLKKLPHGKRLRGKMFGNLQQLLFILSCIWHFWCRYQSLWRVDCRSLSTAGLCRCRTLSTADAQWSKLLLPHCMENVMLSSQMGRIAGLKQL